MGSVRTSYRRLGNLRLRQFAVLLLFAASQLLVGVHHAFEEHTLCPVDGQWAHGSHQHVTACCPVEEAETVCSDEECSGGACELPMAAPGDEEGEHASHCSVPTLRELRLVDWTQPPALEVAAVRALEPAALRAQLRGPREELYRLAPKNSPPAARSLCSTVPRRANRERPHMSEA